MFDNQILCLSKMKISIPVTFTAILVFYAFVNLKLGTQIEQRDKRAMQCIGWPHDNDHATCKQE